jgi:hypothetical protein
MLDADAGRRDNSPPTFSEVRRNSIDKIFLCSRLPRWLTWRRTCYAPHAFSKAIGRSEVPTQRDRPTQSASMHV